MKKLLITFSFILLAIFSPNLVSAKGYVTAYPVTELMPAVHQQIETIIDSIEKLNGSGYFDYRDILRPNLVVINYDEDVSHKVQSHVVSIWKLDERELNHTLYERTKLWPKWTSPKFGYTMINNVHIILVEVNSGYHFFDVDKNGQLQKYRLISSEWGIVHDGLFHFEYKIIDDELVPIREPYLEL